MLRSIVGGLSGASRISDGHVLPTWEQVVALGYEPWTEERLVVDSVGEAAADVERILGWVGA